MAMKINTNIVNDRDGYLLDAKSVKGGYTVVATFDDLALLPLATQINGSLAFTADTKKTYRFDGTNWTEESSGGGEPAAYIKDALVEDEKLTLTKKDDSTVELDVSGKQDKLEVNPTTTTETLTGLTIDGTSYEIKGQPDAYIKDASLDNEKLTLTKNDDTTVELDVSGKQDKSTLDTDVEALGYLKEIPDTYATKQYVDEHHDDTKQDKLGVNPTETTDVLTGLTIDGTSYRIQTGLDYTEITISGSTGTLSQEDFDTLKNNHNAVIKWADYSYINYYTAEDDGNIYYTNSGTDSTATPTILQTKITINKETKEYYNELFTFPQVESVTDVKVDGTSVVESGVANIDLTGKQDKLEVNPTETTETLTGLKIDGTSYKVDTGKVYTGGNAIRINEGESRLPEEYQEVEYLQSNGTQWIDTGIVPTNTTGFKTKIFINRVVADVHYFIGVRESEATNSRFGVFAGLGSAKGFGWNDGILCEGFGVGVWNDTSLNYKNDRKGIINTQTLALTETLVPITRSIYLFAANWDTPRGFAIGKIKEVEFTEDQNTIAHLIPCYRKADNKPGMYDIIRNSFYTNSGVGEDFTVGLIIENNSINVKYDNATIKLNANNELYAIGTGGDVGLEDVILEEDMNAYTNIGNIKNASAASPVLVASAGQTLKDVFNKILGLVRIMPTISRQPAVDVAFTSSLGDEYGTSIQSITSSITTVDGQYTCDGHTQDAQVTWSNFGVSGDQGTMAGQTGTLTFVAPYVVGTSSPYVFTASADNSEGVPAKDNTGADTDVKVAAGTKTKEKSFSITSKNYPYYKISTETGVQSSGTKGSADLITDNGQTINYQQNNYVHILMLKGDETEQPNKTIEIYNDQFRVWGSMLGGTTKLGSVTFTQANGVRRTYWDYRTNNVSQANDSAKLRLH